MAGKQRTWSKDNPFSMPFQKAEWEEQNNPNWINYKGPEVETWDVFGDHTATTFQTKEDFLSSYDPEIHGPMYEKGRWSSYPRGDTHFGDHYWTNTEDDVKWGDDKYRSLYYDIDAETGQTNPYLFNKAIAAQYDDAGNLLDVSASKRGFLDPQSGGGWVGSGPDLLSVAKYGQMYESDVLEGLFDTSQWETFTEEQKGGLAHHWLNKAMSTTAGE